MPALRRALRILAWGIGALLAATTLYLGTATALMLWPARGDPSAPAGGSERITAFVVSNGVHTDLVLPLQAGGIDWRRDFPPSQARAAPADAAWIGFGWGDREFYLNTPTWADLTLRRALGALVGTNPSLLHVSWLATAQLRPGSTWQLTLTPAQYARLAAHVRASLPQGRAVPIPGAHYGADDAFYEATGRYHLFETCNTWTGRGLRAAGVPVSRWTPFDFNVTWSLAPYATP
ncbi:MAG TPA: TIGR02117 family protein [Burkholderiaceae bacterium]|nr:TIGR02117 family protein [Burkholderiaceae bacterium]